jgi:hypothetical protein
MDSETRDAFERLATDLRAEIRSVDTGLRTFIGELATDLRAEIRSGDAETRAYVDASMATSAAETRAYVAASGAETRRHFDVVAEALRGDIRSLAELMAISNERMEGRLNEHGGRITSLEGRVLGLEARVSTLEDGRTPPRPRRRR